MRTHYHTLLFTAASLLSLSGVAQKSDDAHANPLHSPAYRPAGTPDRDGDRTILFYCTPTYSTGSADGDYIESVTLGTISNLFSGPSASPFYEDWSFLGPDYTTRLVAGSAASLSVTAGTYVPAGDWEAYQAWIDYDQDGIFEPTESIGFVQTTSAGQTQSMNFTVDASALQGYTTLRVLNAYNGVNPLDPCGSYTYGETEDYTILIENGQCIPLLGYGTTDGDFLGEIVCDDINVTNPIGGNVAPYSDFFMEGTQFARGGSHTITLTSGDYVGTEWLGAWADWNFDGDWDDAGEQLGLTSVVGAGMSTTFNFTVPATSLVGYTKLRTRAIWNGSAATACSDAGYGETNDFTISIVTGVYPCLPVQGWGSVAGDGFADVTLDGLTYLGSLEWPFYQRALNVFRYDQGTSHTIDITNGGWAGERFQMYIDMNDDGDLTDAGEDLGYVQASAVGQLLGLSFTIPGSCPPGQHTLRLRAFDPANFPPADACSNHGYGETIDFQVAVEDPAGVCIPHLSDWTTDEDFINGVTLNTLSNPNTGAEFGAAYHDFTAMGTTLDVGSTYDLTIQGGGYAGDYYFGFIDWNADNDWDDAGEDLGNVMIGTVLGTGTISFTAPSATLGDKRLRVRCRASNVATACSDGGYGETEDYTVTLQSGTGLGAWSATGASVIPQVALGATEIRTGADWNGASYRLMDATGRTLASGTIKDQRTMVAMASMAAGAYTMMVFDADRSERLRFVWEQR